MAVDRRHAQWPRTIGEHHHPCAKPGARLDRILARSDRINAAVEAVFRPWAELDAWLLVVLAVAFDPAGAQRFQDHRRTFVEPLAALLHRLSEGGEFPACQAAADAKTKPPLAQDVEHDRPLSDAQRVVPGQD